uniref:Ribosome biogenesis protein BOP1 homolog n=1 Tax=Rhizophora mucronata TaxID=61149 RepID=A0A2P2KXG0_RHIMU
MTCTSLQGYRQMEAYADDLKLAFFLIHMHTEFLTFCRAKAC